MHLLGKTIKQVVHSVTRGAYFGAQARRNIFQVPESFAGNHSDFSRWGSTRDSHMCEWLLEHVISCRCLQVRVFTRAHCFLWVMGHLSLYCRRSRWELNKFEKCICAREKSFWWACCHFGLFLCPEDNDAFPQ